MLIRVSIITFVALVMTQPALAGEPDADTRARQADKADGSARFVFESDGVQGESMRDDSTPVRARRASRHESLIGLRSTFISELCRLARDL